MLEQMHASGIIEDLTDYYPWASDNVKHNLEYSPVTLEAASWDGRLYAIPAPANIVANICFLWMRNDWLKWLGLKPPKTTDQVMALARAFTRNDPDGNGKADTLGFPLDYFVVREAKGFFNGYGAYPSVIIHG
jgi:putative aldouronate transport system substrate-binding protein